MRTFLIVCCLAYAAGQGYNYAGHGSPGPQGYTYQTPVVHNEGAGGGGFFPAGLDGGSFLSGGHSGGGHSGGAVGGGSFSSGGHSGSSVGGGSISGGAQSGFAVSGGSFNSGGHSGGAVGGGSISGGAQSGGSLGGNSFSNGGHSGGSSGGASFGGVQFGGNQGGSQSFGSKGGSSGATQGGQAGFSGGNVRTEYVKEFFTYHVDDKEYININHESQNEGVVKKNIRVVIIKGPEISGLEDAAVTLTKNVNEQKLAIYVLSKQADIAALTNKLSSSDLQVNHKPEVHYVKYKSESDAEKVKEAIHKQYESLDGPSSSQDGGAVPVHSFATESEDKSSAAAPAPAPKPTTTPAPGYLPSSVI